MTSFNLIIPELNDFISKLGAPEKKGLIITLFTISAAISRPFSGKIADLVGRKIAMYIGICICILIAFLYPFAETVLFFLLLRFLHGFSAGFLPTGSTALITDIIPKNNRGHAMAIFGTFISLGIGVGQSFGSYIYMHSNYATLFVFSGLIAVLSLLLMFKVKESLAVRRKFNLSVLKVKKTDLIEKNVLPAAFIMVLTASCSGIIFVVTPDISSYLGISNKGWFFGMYILSTILIRLFTGSLSDNIGRRKTMLIGCSVLMISMLLIGHSKSMEMYTISALLFGVATGISSPTLFAWTADLSPELRRGIGAGTIFIALECGIMIGSFSTLIFYQSTFESVKYAFNFGAIMAAIALIYLAFTLLKKQH